MNGNGIVGRKKVANGVLDCEAIVGRAKGAFYYDIRNKHLRQFEGPYCCSGNNSKKRRPIPEEVVEFNTVFRQSPYGGVGYEVMLKDSDGKVLKTNYH